MTTENDPSAENQLSRFDVPPAGSPLRTWESGDSEQLVAELDLLLEMAQARAALERLFRDEDVTVADLLAFGRLNYAAFADRFEPVVGLWNDTVLLDPGVRVLWEHRGQ